MSELFRSSLEEITVSARKNSKISNLNLTKDDIFQDDIKRDKLIEKSHLEVKKEMDACSNTPFNAFDFAIKTHKDPVSEARIYLANEDVIQVFQVISIFIRHTKIEGAIITKRKLNIS